MLKIVKSEFVRPFNGRSGLYVHVQAESRDLVCSPEADALVQLEATNKGYDAMGGGRVGLPYMDGPFKYSRYFWFYDQIVPPQQEG